VTEVDSILHKALDGNRISAEEATILFASTDMTLLGNVASRLAKKKRDDNIITYIIDRNINYTNICVTDCSFCAFYRKKEDLDSYVHPFEVLAKKIDETIELGGNQILLQGGHNVELKIEYFEDLFKKIKERFDIKLHALSPPEIVHTSKISKISITETLKRLHAAGLDSIPGGGAEILVNRVRQIISPAKCTTDEWLNVMGKAHQMEIPSTATMMFGHVETLEERVEHLIRLREQQDKTGGFTAFIAWSMQPGNNPLGRQLSGAKATGLEYLKTLAISRIVLDNFDNIQSSWVTQGPKIGQMSLFYGANDMGSVMIEENVVKEAGASFRMTEKEIIRLIEDGGFIPQRRNMQYQFI
jgi:cyclic dehypoxanthinyl futalosine synthase